MRQKILILSLLLLSCLSACKKDKATPGPGKVNISIVHILSVSPDTNGHYWREGTQAYAIGYELRNKDIVIAAGSTQIRAKPTEPLPVPVHFSPYPDVDLNTEGSKQTRLVVYAVGYEPGSPDYYPSVIGIDTMQFKFTDAQFAQRPASVMLKQRSTIVQLSLSWHD